MVLAAGPWDLFHLYAAGPAVDPPHGIEKEDNDPPERHELKSSNGQCIIAGPGEPHSEQSGLLPLRAFISISMTSRVACLSNRLVP